MVSFCNGKIYTQSYENKKWNTKGTYYTISNSFIRNMELKELNNELYLIYSTGSKLSILKWNEQKATWNEVTSISDSVGDFSSNIINNKLYISAITGTMADKAGLYVLNSNKIDYLGTYCNGMSGQPKVVSINNKIYVTTRLGSNKIKLYLYSNNSFSEIQNSMSSNTYDVKALNNKMYFVLGKSEEAKLTVYKFDGSSWGNIKSEINVAFPTLTVSQGNLYIMAHDNNTRVLVYSFNEKSEEFSQEGTIVDTATQDSNLISIDNNIYVALYRTLDGSIAVKEKETVNSLMSLTIVPPEKCTYSVNEKINTKGLKVIANYKKEQATVTNYSIKGFDTSKPGAYNVTITYEGISNTFSYEVIGKGEIIQKEKPIIPSKLVVNDIPNIKDVIYTGKNITPDVIIKDGKYTLVKNKDYKLSYSNNKNCGTAKITIAGIGNYTGVITKTFKIVPQKVTGLKFVTSSSNSITVKWKKLKDVTGYKVYLYDYSKNEYQYYKKTNMAEIKIKNLNPNTKYKIKVKAYKEVNGVQYCGARSDAFKTMTSPKTVTNIKVKETTNNTVKLNWNKVSGTTKYKIYIYDNKKGNYVYYGKTGETSIKIKNLKPNTKYKVKIRAYRTYDGVQHLGDMSSAVSTWTKNYVYGTTTGKKYHIDKECGGKNSYEITLKKAKSKGLTPCKKCAK